MPKSQFTRAQDEVIASFIPELELKLQRRISTRELTKWKQQTASRAMDNPAFASLDLTSRNRKAWFLVSIHNTKYIQMIVRKFTNHVNRRWSQSKEAKAQAKTNPFLDFAPKLTGRALFAEENDEDIKVAVAESRARTGQTCSAGLYQTELKSRWDALAPEEKSEFNTRAEEDMMDVSRNQVQFPTTMNLALNHLCRNNYVGDAEMMLLYGFRNEAGDVISGAIHAHAADDKANFGAMDVDFQAQLGDAWGEHVAMAIPCPLKSTTKIPWNSNNHPVFPTIDLNGASPSDLRLVLADYLDACWEASHQGTVARQTSIPWSSIVSAPADYYDAEMLPAPLDDPQNLSVVQVLLLSQHFVSTSGPSAPAPFAFRTTGTGAPPPPPPASPRGMPASPRMPTPPADLISPNSPPHSPGFPVLSPPHSPSTLTSHRAVSTLPPSLPPSREPSPIPGSQAPKETKKRSKKNPKTKRATEAEKDKKNKKKTKWKHFDTDTRSYSPASNTAGSFRQGGASVKAASKFSLKVRVHT
ncbi:hypothetical protein C8F01DRAFT_1338436 [Mycena amicta]|nr:hypothetical protein C8F01DRAFT_1338436 [Mycena amicta]